MCRLFLSLSLSLCLSLPYVHFAIYVKLGFVRSFFLVFRSLLCAVYSRLLQRLGAVCTVPGFFSRSCGYAVSCVIFFCVFWGVCGSREGGSHCRQSSSCTF